MTVIAYTKGVIATDSGYFVDELVPGSCDKIYKTRSGMLVGCAGDFDAANRFLAWLEKGGKGKHPRGNFEAIVVYPNGRVWLYDETEFPSRMRDKYCVIGAEAGVAAALGALFAGADAKTAVRASIRHSTHAKGPVRVKRL